MSMRSPTTTRDIGRRARAIRENAGLRLSDVAAAANIDPGNLSKLENGKGPASVGTAVLVRLAGALRVPISALLEDTARKVAIRRGSRKPVENPPPPTE